MKTFCFTVDDNIRFFADLASDRTQNIFDHPYLAMYLRLHEKFGLKVQLNLFYRSGDFDLSQFPDAYRPQFEACADWLKLSFHSQEENELPYENSDYQEVYDHCQEVHRQILRFAGPASLAKTTTVHYCQTTDGGRQALVDQGYRGLLGLFGSEAYIHTSYSVPLEFCRDIFNGHPYTYQGATVASIDIVLNNHSKEAILNQLKALSHRSHINVMIHEQYFYPDYRAYQPEFEEKLEATFEFLSTQAYKSAFFEACI